MDNVRSIFLAGVKFVIPLLLTLFFLYWIFIAVDNFLRWFFLLFLEESQYVRGFGWLAILSLIFGAGLMSRIATIQSMIQQVRFWLLKIPVIRTLYHTASNLTMLFTREGTPKGQVVSLKTPVGKVLGVVTQEDLARLPEGIGEKEEIAVYVQMSYNMGGYTIVVPKKSINPLDLSVREAMTLSLTAYVSGSE